MDSLGVRIDVRQLTDLHDCVSGWQILYHLPDPRAFPLSGVYFRSAKSYVVMLEAAQFTAVLLACEPLTKPEFFFVCGENRRLAAFFSHLELPLVLKDLDSHLTEPRHRIPNRGADVSGGNHDEQKELDSQEAVTELDQPTRIVGILNLTPDSFYDGGKYLDPSLAVDRALELEQAGALMIDIGAESSRPGAQPISPEDERARILNVVRRIRARSAIKLSVDTYKRSVVEAVLGEGVDYINDIYGLNGVEELAELVGKSGAGIIAMHILGTPQTMQQAPRYRCLPWEIVSYLRSAQQKAWDNGISPAKIILDPGIGFGKTVRDNLWLVRHPEFLSGLRTPVMYGPSRKSFLGALLDLPVQERLEGTAATVALLAWLGVAYIRVHDVKEMVRVTKVVNALKSVERLSGVKQ